MACSAIRGCLANLALYSVLEKRTPKGFWAKLHAMHIGKNMCNKLMLKKRLYSLRISEGGDIVVHIQKFDQVSIDLLNLGVKMDEDKSLLLLCSLPFLDDPLVTTLLYGKETLYHEEVVSVLRSNEQRERLTKEGVSWEGLAIGERPGRGKERSKQRGHPSHGKARRLGASSVMKQGTSSEIVCFGRRIREKRRQRIQKVSCLILRCRMTS